MSTARKGIKPTPVAVNKAKADWNEHLFRARRMDTLTINNLGRYLNPESLFFGIMEVDELCKEENNRCSPEHCDRPVRLSNIARNGKGVPTAKP